MSTPPLPSSSLDGNCTPLPPGSEGGADYRWLRSRIALLNSEIEELIRPIYWAPYLGDTCQHLVNAVLQLKAARDASHTAEVRITAASEQLLAPADQG